MYGTYGADWGCECLVFYRAPAPTAPMGGGGYPAFYRSLAPTVPFVQINEFSAYRER